MSWRIGVRAKRAPRLAPNDSRARWPASLANFRPLPDGSATISVAPRWGAVLRSKPLRHTLIGAIAAIALALPLGVLAFVKSGLFDVGAANPHTKLTEWLTHETMIHSVRRHAREVTPPDRFTAAAVAAGFCAYETHCVACHGAPAVARQHWAGGMEPSPPYLLDVSQRFSSRELFWIVDHGIKMTGMPAWRGTMSDAQLWDVVGFLEAMRDLPPQTYVQWRSRGMCGGFKGPWPAPEPPSSPPFQGRG
jgi:mono/diheme cytochrome c family protein